MLSGNPKKEKTQELTKLANKGNSAVCGKKSSNLCLILFLKGKGQALFDQYTDLLPKYLNDPISFTFTSASEEPQIA